MSKINEIKHYIIKSFDRTEEYHRQTPASEIHTSPADFGFSPDRYELILDNDSRVKKLRVEDAHKRAWEFIYNFYDEGGLLQLLSWRTQLSANHPAIAMINAVDSWKNAVMSLYLNTFKPAILTDEWPIISYESCGVCPFSFTQIYNVIIGI
jgi:hypothetical protein